MRNPIFTEAAVSAGPPMESPIELSSMEASIGKTKELKRSRSGEDVAVDVHLCTEEKQLDAHL